MAPNAYVEEALQWIDGKRDALVEAARGWGATAATGGLAGARVLVADDNADMRDYLARILGPHCEVIVARDGEEALGLARTRQPSLVLTDVMMPRLDGFGLLRALRATSETQHVPVVMLSARAGEEARLDGLRAGADDYLIKPFTARELVARLEVQLARARMRQLEEEQMRRLNRLLMNAPVGIAVLSGPEHRFESANTDYVRVVGGRDVVGKTVREAFPDLAGQGIYELLDTVYRSGEPYIGRSVRLVLDEAEGPREGYFDFLYQPDRGADGVIEGILVVVFDVTELSRARDAAEAANRAKDEFLAVLGHELRNPLAPIVTALKLMQRRTAGAERELAVIDRQVAHLIRLVDDLLDVSRVARGKVELKPEVVELASIVRESVEQTRPLFESRSHSLTVHVPSTGLSVRVDPTRLAQVVTNLLVNAAKYTDPGGRVEVVGALERGDVVLRVRDNGVGISPELLPQVFEMFVQGRQSIDRALGGARPRAHARAKHRPSARRHDRSAQCGAAQRRGVRRPPSTRGSSSRRAHEESRRTTRAGGDARAARRRQSRRGLDARRVPRRTRHADARDAHR
jgi:signal transduction histidine kinase